LPTPTTMTASQQYSRFQRRMCSLPSVRQSATMRLARDDYENSLGLRAARHRGRREKPRPLRRWPGHGLADDLGISAVEGGIEQKRTIPERATYQVRFGLFLILVHATRDRSTLRQGAATRQSPLDL
jgi:hypothetical protein